MIDVEQKAYRGLTVSLTTAGSIHISQEDDDSSGEFDLGVIVEPAAVPRLVKALRALVEESETLPKQRGGLG